jgi:hypothetical protein
MTAGVSGSARAQVTGLPVENSGIAAGFTLGAAVASPSHDYGGGTAYGLRAALGGPRFGISGVISRYDVVDPFPNQTGFGLAGNLDLLGSGPRLVSATLQGGAEAFFLNGKAKWHFPVGLGIVLHRPEDDPVIETWIAPRLDIFRSSFDNPTQTKTRFGLSGGLDLNLTRSLGLTFAGDRAFGRNGFNPMTWSAGVEYRFSSASGEW